MNKKNVGAKSVPARYVLTGMRPPELTDRTEKAKTKD
jgi:hypothetical protein